MKKILILISMVAIACLALIGIYMLQEKEADTSAYKHIAFFVPTTHPALQEIERGFKETLASLSDQNYRYTVFNANGNRTLLRGQAEEMADGAYDLLCTVGASCSQTVAELLHRKGKETPHVFCGLEGADLSRSLQDTYRYATGMYVQPNYKKQIALLHKIKPDIKRLLLVYDPAHGVGLEQDKDAIASYCASHGTELQAVEVFQTNEIQQKVSALLSDVDVVMVLIDNTVVAGIDALITICNRYGVTLLVSDMASGKKGAALAYGITEYASGSGAAGKAHALLVEGKQACDLPADAVTTFQLTINKHAMHAQGLAIDDAMIKQLEAEQ